MTDVRVVSYNVRSMRDDVDSLAVVLRAQSADVVALQELPRFWRWRSACARLARLCGLIYVAGGATTTGPGLFVAPAVTVTGLREVRLSASKGLHARGTVVADLAVGGASLRLASVHLGLDAEQRVRHAREVVQLLGATDDAVVAGDLNEAAGSEAWSAFERAGLRDAYAAAPRGTELTFPARGPRHRIDAVLVGPAIDVRGCGVAAQDAHTLRASDHLPVTADIAVARAVSRAELR